MSSSPATAHQRKRCTREVKHRTSLNTEAAAQVETIHLLLRENEDFLAESSEEKGAATVELALQAATATTAVPSMNRKERDFLATEEAVVEE